MDATEITQDDLQEVVETAKRVDWNEALEAAIILVAGILIIKVLGLILNRIGKHAKWDKTATGYIRSFLRIILYFALLITVVDKLGFPTTSFIALLSLFALAVSLSVQNALSNVVNGILIITSRPFSVGNFIDVEGTAGTVEKVGLMYTTLASVDNKILLIPNSTITGSKITNFSVKDIRRMDIEVRVGYEYAAERVIPALLRAAEGIDSLETGEKAPAALVSSYAETGVVYVLRVWVKSPDYWPVNQRLLRGVRSELEKDGIAMTYGAHIIRKE